jgi:hypothetical protein
MSRVLLDAEDFQTLVTGGILEQNGVQVALKDIGYYEMGRILGEAIENLK